MKSVPTVDFKTQKHEICIWSTWMCPVVRYKTHKHIPLYAGRVPQLERVKCRTESTPVTKGKMSGKSSYWQQGKLKNGPVTRYAKVRDSHAPRTFSPPPRVSDPDMHHDTCVTHLPWCMPGSLTSGFLWSQWRGKCSRHSRRMGNPYQVRGQ